MACKMLMTANPLTRSSAVADKPRDAYTLHSSVADLRKTRPSSPHLLTCMIWRLKVKRGHVGCPTIWKRWGSAAAEWRPDRLPVDKSLPACYHGEFSSCRSNGTSIRLNIRRKKNGLLVYRLSIKTTRNQRKWHWSIGYLWIPPVIQSNLHGPIIIVWYSGTLWQLVTRCNEIYWRKIAIFLILCICRPIMRRRFTWNFVTQSAWAKID